VEQVTVDKADLLKLIEAAKEHAFKESQRTGWPLNDYYCWSLAKKLEESIR